METNSAFVRRLDESDPTGESTKNLLLCMDPPRHTRVRRVGNRCFTPRALAGLEDDLRERAQRIIWAAKREGTGDFVIDVARHLPLQAIAGLMGIPESDRQRLFHWSDQMAGSEDPEYANTDLSGVIEMFAYAHSLAEAGSRSDLGDVTSRLVQPDTEGQRLSSEEFAFFFMILAVAGNETTRQAITFGTLAFLRESGPVGTVAIRTSRHRRRRDPALGLTRRGPPAHGHRGHRIAGQLVRQGERVGLYFASANFDEEVFDDPRRFDIGRAPNPHVTFGAGGPHFCIGANLSRLELKVMFDVIADELTDLKLTGPRPPPLLVAQRHQTPARRAMGAPDDDRPRRGWSPGWARRPTSLEIQTVEVGDPGVNQVRIAVEAFCLDFNDIDTIRGRYGLLKFEPPFVIGMAAAGTVEAVGPGCEALLGRRVVGTTAGVQGGYASAALLDGATLQQFPAWLSAADGDGDVLPLSAELPGASRPGTGGPGDVVLVHAAAGGVGSAAVQLAKAFGATVIATAGTDEKVELLPLAGCRLRRELPQRGLRRLRR